MTADTNRFGLAGSIELFIFFGQRNQHGRFDSQIFERRDGRTQLPFAPVNQQNVWHLFLVIMQAFESTGDNFMNAAKIVNAFNVFDFVTAIAGLERQSINELN